ncbi:MAG TPA: hypothetical protein PK351_03745 [Spirochaetota bacterium]|nr:hypothetical protein [Spirochaetota bacterium]
MKKNLIIFSVILIITGCSRTLFLNQKAEVLPCSQKESTFTGTLEGGFAIFFSPEPHIFESDIGFNTNLGFQQRFGLPKHREYYFAISNNVTFRILIIPIAYIDIQFDNGFKFLLTSKKENNANLSLIVNWASGIFSSPFIGYIQTVGVKLIGDYKNFYYGIPFKFSLICQHIVGVEFELGLVLGGEYVRNNFVLRNEFGISTFIIPVGAYNHIVLCIGYGISIGKRYY